MKTTFKAFILALSLLSLNSRATEITNGYCLLNGAEIQETHYPNGTCLASCRGERGGREGFTGADGTCQLSRPFF